MQPVPPGILMGRAFAVVTELAPPGATTRYLAVYGLSWGFATVAAPLVGTWLIGAFGPGTLRAAMSAVCLAMAAAQPALLRRLTTPHPPTAPSATPHPPILVKARDGRI